MFKSTILLITLTLTSCNSKTTSTTYPEFEIGVVADCQYCNCDASNTRFYKKSAKRLQDAVHELNQHHLAYAIHLGDFIDRDFKSFDTVAPIWNKLKAPKYHVLGNHDFSVTDSLKPLVLKKMYLQNRYYSIVKNNWRFIVLDGNDLSVHGALNKKKKQQTDSLFQLLQNKNLPNVVHWNGGLSNTQLQWVKKELALATTNNESVGFFCHFAALGKEQTHNLLNYQQFLDSIRPYDCVKFYFNGHNHAGSYVQKNGVHFLNFKGMVDTQDSTAFATVKFRKDSILVRGFGREISRGLKIKVAH